MYSNMRFASNRLHQVVDRAFLIIFIVILGCNIAAVLSTVHFGGSRDQNHTALGELIQGVVVQQEVPVREAILADTLCYDVLFATYQRLNPCVLTISLIQGSNRRSIRLDASELKDNRTFPLCFQAKGFSTGKAILEIAGLDGRTGLSPTVWMTSDVPYGEAVLNNKPIKKGLVFQAYAKRHLCYFYFWAGLFVLLGIVSLLILIVRNALFREKVAAQFIRYTESGFWKFLKTLTDSQRSVFVCSLIAWTLSLVMATVSQFSAHPDEGMHSASASYYETHDIPPAVGDPEARSTYRSRYGVSYINQSGIDYFLIGKFSTVIRSIVPLKDFYLHRCFNIFLFLALCLMVWRAEDRLLFFPIIITPQIWYIASYTNNDFFPFVIMMALCFEFLDSRSSYNRAVGGDSVFYAVPAGVILGILSISKTNYLVFVLFAGFYLLWKTLKANCFNINRNLVYSPISKSFLLILFCAASIYSIRTGFDIYQNGFDKNDKLKHYANRVAAKGFKPIDIETDIRQTDPGLRLKEKGDSLKSLLLKRGWHISSLTSFFGVYGWMKIIAPEPYYQWIVFLFCLLMSYVIIQSGLAFQMNNIFFLMGSLSFICLMVFVSLYYSWIHAFQPQGRYLFPILGMLSVLFYESREYLNRHVLGFLILMMFAASFWSFVFIGIYHIEKMV
jgi:hypothetical protein